MFNYKATTFSNYTVVNNDRLNKNHSSRILAFLAEIQGRTNFFYFVRPMDLRFSLNYLDLFSLIALVNTRK